MNDKEYVQAITFAINQISAQNIQCFTYMYVGCLMDRGKRFYVYSAFICQRRNTVLRHDYCHSGMLNFLIICSPWL